METSGINTHNHEKLQSLGFFGSRINGNSDAATSIALAIEVWASSEVELMETCGGQLKVATVSGLGFFGSRINGNHLNHRCIGTAV